MTETSAMRVLLVDDHPVVREGLRSMLEGASIAVVGEAGTGADAVRMVTSLDPDVVLLDLQLPDLDGAAVVRQLAAQGARARVLMLSMHDDPTRAKQCVDAGAAGYLLKGVGRADLLAALRAVHNGATVFDPGVLRAMVARPEAGPAPLTAVEREVLRHVAEGLTNREIGARMRWSVATVKKYVQRVIEKLGVTDRTGAAVQAARRGWLDEP